MKTSPEFRGTRLVVVGATGSGTVDLLQAVATRFGSDAPERLVAGCWEVLRADVTVASTPVELVCLANPGPFAGVRDLMLGSADGVVFMFDVSPGRIVESRRVFDRHRPKLEDEERPFALQYHRIEREPRFDAERMDAWLGLDGRGLVRFSTTSDAPEQPFERIVSGLIPGASQE
ncbi:hypothetical protein [Haloferula sp. A504]|uniref:hypothetical protein n=1 Tax=Haloferula sp. A504 TaxID=3373601 RepID=UPI0031C73035|nr:hypothetical protein [Verrucomicrobiaceae bacterium E54]